MQTVAEIWLILTLTGSGLAVGLTTALQFLPMLLFGAWGGLIADRVPKRRLLMLTQALHMIAAADAARPRARRAWSRRWLVFALVFFRGCVNAVDYPTRQAFVMEIVGSDRVVNAVSLNSVLVHSARIIGPALAGVLIATVGVEPCFALNAASFAVMIVALAGMDTARAAAGRDRAARARGGPRGPALRPRRRPSSGSRWALMAIVGTLGFNFQAILPLLAAVHFDGGASATRCWSARWGSARSWGR